MLFVNLYAMWNKAFYLLSFYLYLSVCPSVHQQFCLHDNSSPVQAKDHQIWARGVQDLGDDPYCFVGWLTLTFKVKFNLKSKLTPYWTCLLSNLSSIEARITKFRPEMQITLIKILIVFGVDWPWQTISNFISKSCLLATSLLHFEIFVRQSLVNSPTSHMTPHICSFPYACQQGCAMDCKAV